MEKKLEYEKIDTSNPEHKNCLIALYNDKRAREYYNNKCKTINEFIDSFNDVYTNEYEKLIKIDNIYIGWIRIFPVGDYFEVECIILEKHRGKGFSKTILKDLIDKNYSILLNIKKSNYSALKSIKSLPFFEESRNNDERIIKNRNSDKGIITYKLEKNRCK